MKLKNTHFKKMLEWFNQRKKLRNSLIVLGSLLVTLFIAVNIIISIQDISELKQAVPQPTLIYDANNEVATKLASSKTEGVKRKDIPDIMVQAIVAVEDKEFFSHHGIYYSGIISAVFKNITAGEVVAGGSTITQQLAKNVFLTQDRTFSRKIKEYFLTKKIERTYTKDEIIEMYMNQIYFGEGAWGIKRAAKSYFDKEVKDLTISEAATIAGLIKAPSAYSPYKNFNKSIERRNVVLGLMKEQGYISEEQYSQEKESGLVLRRGVDDKYKGKYSQYVDYIVREAMDKYELTQNEILAGGYRIYTELDPKKQQAVEDVVNNDSYFKDSGSDQLMQTGVVLMNPKTGGVPALVGGRGPYQFLQFNHATQLKRQPGSTLKPLAVYVPALEQGYEVYDVLKDEPFNIKEYAPQNSDHTFHGNVTMYEAVAKSYNVSAVWLLEQIGLDKGLKSLERFGIPLDPEDRTYPIALGGMHVGTSPFVMAQAYSAFANDGVQVEAHAIREIQNAEGETIGKWYKKETRVTNEKVAQKMTYLLKGVIERGTGEKAKVNNIDTAGKTGTTQLVNGPSTGAKDSWFVGYTPDLVGAIWVGYDKTDSEHYVPGGSQITTTMFRDIMKKANGNPTQKAFQLSLIPEADYTKQLKTIEEEKRRKEEERKRKEEEEQRKEQQNEWIDKVKEWIPFW
ncbi:MULTISPECIES: transglycosylase domain-containing protein [Bacillus cereus group]|uniref:Penicillin-binding protein 1A n=1 Tax=Bacillus mycoides TaxID=1405 RepID=A0A1E8BSK5_BACMY|nr:PBP1A family penicillin-binding protein [Bacillus mycoides]MBJ8072936.1 PBP1A family penicillin-binding protein [Bacillus cereus]MBJ8186313.1 PBP1A family penicillin-binding protein [Bacillus cereus]OFD45390.1 peptidase [Bacillus mycoides]OFD48704.1 peptidase [Bacillus mycoides]OFD98194.1 peptidase [Bacillus mycoides]